MVKPAVAMSLPLAKNRPFAKLQAKRLYIGPELFEQYFEDSKQISGENLTKVLEANMSYTLPERFRECKARVLSMVGEKEKGAMLNSNEQIVAAVNGAGVVMPGIGHGVSLTNPDLFNRIMEAWVEGKELPAGLKIIK